MMNTPKSVEKFAITADWTPRSKLLKEKFSHLSDTDLKVESGREEELLTRLQQRLKKNRNDVIAIIKGVEPIPVAQQATPVDTTP
jgi:hypothetical protein